MRCPVIDHHCYSTEDAAKRGMDKLIRNLGTENDAWRKLNVFQCDSCGYFHVGKTRAKKTRAVPTFRQLKLKLQKLERDWTRQQREYATTLGRIIELDISLTRHTHR